MPIASRCQINLYDLLPFAITCHSIACKAGFLTRHFAVDVRASES